MVHRLLRVVVPVAALVALRASPLVAQAADSLPALHVMPPIVVTDVAARGQRASHAGNARLERALSRYDARIAVLEGQLDSLRTVADSLDRDRVYFEAATAHARMRRTQMEQRLRDLEARASRGDSSSRK
jgi:hypothetical protein